MSCSINKLRNEVAVAATGALVGLYTVFLVQLTYESPYSRCQVFVVYFIALLTCAKLANSQRIDLTWTDRRKQVSRTEEQRVYVLSRVPRLKIRI